jgi:urease accessory protein
VERKESASRGLATLMLLVDGRLPAGGHAHSGGLEAAVVAGAVTDLAGLEAFLRGRLATAGLVAAAFAAAATLICAGPTDAEPDAWAELEAELDARTPSAVLRSASRAQGRSLLRAGRAMWTLPPWATGIPHHANALGLVGAAAGLAPGRVALAAAHGGVTGSASAAVKVLALDPYPVHALLARLAGECEETAERATEAATVAVAAGTLRQLPASGAPLLDLGAEDHATWEVRLFAS